MGKDADFLNGRVEDTRTELEDAKKRTLEARQLEDTLVADLAGYERAFAAEMRRERRDTKTLPLDLRHR